MPATIRLSESAVADLEAIRDWYGDQGVADVGDRLAADILQRIERLRTHPDSGCVVPEFGQAFLREIIFPPFRIVYRRDKNRIRVVRIWRSERPLAI